MHYVFGGSGIAGSCRSYSTIVPSDQRVLELEHENLVHKVERVSFDYEITKIREEFDAAKERFLKIPYALEAMPKMNPKGKYCCCVFLS